jgi:hypothetical protein
MTETADISKLYNFLGDLKFTLKLENICNELITTNQPAICSEPDILDVQETIRSIYQHEMNPSIVPLSSDHVSLVIPMEVYTHTYQLLEKNQLLEERHWLRSTDNVVDWLMKSSIQKTVSKKISS